MVAIACLAAMEHDRGNMRALGMHLEGLKQIVSLRGGLDAVRSSNAMAGNMVFWCTMISIDEPSLLPASYGDPLSLDETGLYTLMVHDGSQANLFEYGLDLNTASVLHDVQKVSQLYTEKLEHGTPEDGVKILSSLCVVLRKLLQISKSPVSDDASVAGLSASCRLAGCIHVFTPISAYFPSPTLMLNQLVRDLKASLTLMIRALRTGNHLLLWLLSVGGVTAHFMPERLWFVGHLAVVVSDLGIGSWEEMRRHLVQLAFHDNFCDVSFRALWDEVQHKQELFSLVSASMAAA